MSRERDVRNALATALEASGAFSGVWITGLPENFGQAASDLTAAAIEPSATSMTTGWDAQLIGALDYTATLTVTLLARGEDAQLRDELAEQLLDVLANTVNGQSLASFTLPGKTMVTGWQWQPPSAPERRIRATVTFSYLVEWANFDVSN